MFGKAFGCQKSDKSLISDGKVYINQGFPFTFPKGGGNGPPPEGMNWYELNSSFLIFVQGLLGLNRVELE